MIEASDFYENTSLISVYDNNYSLITRNITRINDWFVIDNRLNVTVIDLQEITGNISSSHGVNVVVDQWVKIQTRVAGRPAPRVSIFPYEKQVLNKTTVSRVFTSGSEVPINFSIINEGKSVLKNLTLKINSSLPLLSREKVDYEPPDLNAGAESDVITVRFKAPFTEQSKLFTISAEAEGNDVFGRAYKASDSTDIEVVPGIDNSIELKKYVSEKVYMGDVAVVSISIKNNGSRTINNASLHDNLPEGLESLNTNLSWNFTLGAYEQKSISYQVKPQKPGTYFFPAGSSSIEYQGSAYNAKPAKLIVNGPYVVLIKSANTYSPVKGESLRIMVEAVNTGDSTAIVKLSDAVPAAYSMESKNKPSNMVLSTMVLHPGDSESVSYTLKVTSSNSFILPPANATVLDQFLYQDERYTQRVTSNSLVINVSKPTELEYPPVNVITPAQTAVPENTETPVTAVTPVPVTPKAAPGFQGYIFIILLIVLWDIKKHKFRG
ncbi:MAG: hypothetical protein O8C62_10540 [Candidatus Methanoperedens sp.]|nr:hypothetical protein [Candidatus Methanoperedens sp.]